MPLLLHLQLLLLLLLLLLLHLMLLLLLLLLLLRIDDTWTATKLGEAEGAWLNDTKMGRGGLKARGTKVQCQR